MHVVVAGSGMAVLLEGAAVTNMPLVAVDQYGGGIDINYQMDGC